jgi:hypothetical protein
MFRAIRVDDLPPVRLKPIANPPPQVAASLISSTPEEDDMSDPKKTSPRKAGPDESVTPQVTPPETSPDDTAASPASQQAAAARMEPAPAPARTPQPASEPPRPAEPPPHATAQVIDLDAIRAEERKATLAYVAEVHELCAIAGRGDLAAGFVAKATPVAQVRRALLEARAAEDEATAIRSQVRPAVTEPRPARNRHRGHLRRPQPALPIGGIHARAE